MERRYPLIDLDLETVEKLFRPLSGAPRPCTFELLKGGHINTNYLVNLASGDRLVLKLCAHGKASCVKEADLLAALLRSVPVPRLHLFIDDPQIFPYPYLVLEWINGSSLNDILTVHPEAAGQIGEEIAFTLLKIGEQRLSCHPSTPIFEYVQECLFERNAVRHLGTELADKLLILVQKRSDFLNRLSPGERLVHGDFQGDNILVRKRAGQWRLAGVLDWELAHEGCYLQDLGSLLRFEGGASTAFQRGLEIGFQNNGWALPSEWRMAGRIWDTAANCEKLTSPRHRGDVTLKAIRMIENCVRDYLPDL
jgi:Ser/Thr protein kinase RdoA (MazF antagonist)